MRIVAALPALLCVTLTVSSCSTPGGGPLGFMMFDANHHVPAAEPLFTRAEDECLDASFLISIFSRMPPAKTERPVCVQLRQQIWASIPFTNLFDPPRATTPAADAALALYQKRQRDAVIGTLILASNKKCGDYVHFLQTYQGNVRVSSSLAAQAFATLATLVTGNGAQWLAAGAAFSSGAGNTVYEVHFANKTVAMLTKAFDNARLDQLRSIQDKMQCSADLYRLPAAIGDVMDYHTRCSLTTGLMQAEDAVDQQRSPNLDTLTKMAEQIDAARAKLAKLGGTASTSSSPGASSGATTTDSGGNDSASSTTTNNQSKPAPSVTPSTGTGSAAPPVEVHVPACPFTTAAAQAKPQKPKPAPKAKAKSKTKPKANAKPKPKQKAKPKR